MLTLEQRELMSADLEIIYSRWSIDCMSDQLLNNCWIAFKANEYELTKRIKKKRNKKSQ